MVFKPTMYKKNIFEINYDKLKKMGVKCLVFDLDNTLATIDCLECPVETKKLINKLQKDFKVFIISNNNRKRIEPYILELNIDGVNNALKPSCRGLRKIKEKYGFKKEEMAMIGDQIVTDILSGNRFDIITILVDPLGEKDLKITGFNRYLEDKIVNSYSKRKKFERGNYYE